MRGVIFEDKEARSANTKPQSARAARAVRVYREVRRSLEEHKHYQEAHRFAARELEIRRLSLLTEGKHWWDRLWGQARANILSLEALYMLLSSYGESWLKPLAWLLLFTLYLFPLAYAWAGVTFDGAILTTRWLWEPGEWFRMGDLVVASLRSASLFPDAIGTSPNFWAQGFQLVERLFVPFLAFLFGLAMRRRFRR